jgi:GTP1/Obg family GTP-binding protein
MEPLGEELACAQHENERASAHSAREQDEHEFPVAQGAFFFWVRCNRIRTVANTVLRSSSTVLKMLQGLWSLREFYKKLKDAPKPINNVKLSFL